MAGPRRRHLDKKTHKNGEPVAITALPKSKADRNSSVPEIYVGTPPPISPAEMPLLFSSVVVLIVALSACCGAFFFMGADVLDQLGSQQAVQPTDSTDQKDAEAAQDAQDGVDDGTENQQSTEDKSEQPDQDQEQNQDQEQEQEQEDEKEEEKKKKCKGDRKIRTKLNNADKLLEEGKADEALAKFEDLLSRHPDSPRATMGKAQALDKLSEMKRSNSLLEQCIEQYQLVGETPNCPKDLALEAAKRGADRMSFRGWSVKAARYLTQVAKKYPEEYMLYADIGVRYLMAGKQEEGRWAFNKVLAKEPDNGNALCHMGFIIKTTDNDPQRAIPYLQRGIDSEQPGTVDGRFYFQLGDAYQRTGQVEKAHVVYRKGVEMGLLMSFWQRSLYNVEGIKAQPWWTQAETGNEKMLQMLERNWKVIRQEGLANMDLKSGTFVPEEENLRDTGEWHQFTLWQRGQRNQAACKKAPKTCMLIEKFANAKTCTRGQVKYSVMQPGVHVWPHCGPTNCRLRAHLGLVVPDGVRIRVTDDTRTWQEGKIIIFDDSFEHEVWHEGETFRLVLIVDMWHPEITPQQRQSLSPI